MDVVTHGGQCCGIKTIYDFPYWSADPINAVMSKKSGREVPKGTMPDLYDIEANAGTPFRTEELPEEKAIDRLDRLIEIVRTHRPSHLIEAVLNHIQRPYWEAELLKREFRLVTTHSNSNTLNSIYVYHKVIFRGNDVTAESAGKSATTARRLAKK